VNYCVAALIHWVAKFIFCTATKCIPRNLCFIYL